MGVFRYSDGGTVAHPTVPQSVAWGVKSYQAILMGNGTARFAAFCWDQQGDNGGVVQLSGPVAVAAVGTPFSGAAVHN